MFAARGIHAVVGAEHHASLLGPLGASFLSLDIWVDEEVAEEAAELLHDFRGRNVEDEPDESNDDEHGDAPDQTGTGVSDDEHGDGAALSSSTADAPITSADSLQFRIERRRRTGAVLLLSVFLTFGTAHMFTRAWLRGIALAGIEVLGLRYLAQGENVGAALVAAAILYDMIGAILRVRHGAGPRNSSLPEARIQRR
jgi:hypothetical protein